MKKEKELSLAFLFEEVYYDDLEFPVFIATRPLIGYTDEKRTLFVERSSSQSFINLETAYHNKLPEGFSLALPIKQILKAQKTLNTNDAVLKTWFEIEKYIYYFSYEGLQLRCCTKETFKEKFKQDVPLLLTEEVNSLNNSLINGEISSDTYFNTLYSEEYSSKISKHGNEEEKENKSFPSINDAIDKMKLRIISQDESVKKIITSIYRSLVFGRDKFKSNILMYGPTGVGKTAIVKSIGEILNIPVVREDMTRFTETGYIGKSVDDILVDLYYNANSNKELAENSILFLDEIDKKVDNGTDKSFNKADVLKSLLTIIEGGKYDITVDKNSIISFDTSKLIVIMGGAFSDLYNEVKDTRNIGFNSKTNTDNDIDIKKIEKYGMPSEFIGRLSLITRLNSLNHEDLVKILKTSDLSALKKYVESFKKLGINIKLDESLYNEIASKAETYQKGARVLNLVADEMFENVFFNVLSEGTENISEIVLGENILKDNNDFKLVKKK